jgi:acyl-CoA thioester hydrolase
MHQQEGPGWWLRRQVLPQHTDHAGVMWHGAYLPWLEEGRIAALAAVGLAYSDLSRRGLEFPVVSLSIDYRQALLHGDEVWLCSEALPRQGVRWTWRSRFLSRDSGLAAEARVDVVLLDVSAGPGAGRVLRRPPADLEQAMAALVEGSPQGHFRPGAPAGT